MKQFIYNYARTLSVCWALFILVLCATPGQYIPSANWLELLSFDKLVHASLFFIMTALLLIFAIKTHRNITVMLFYFLLALIYGALLELMQARWFSHRSADWKDVLANSFGCILALLLLKKLKLVFSNP